ncbi:endonuclease/exonuclease/phosphatase family protein [Alicyclobacillus curvatus]|nr:endonuclease/exonuclease/phosphatase family protein [Alicyclobacillus curvatus]
MHNKNWFLAICTFFVTSLPSPVMAAAREGGASQAVVPQAPSASTSTSTNQTSYTRPVNIMTYNIHFGVGTDGAYDLTRIANVIRHSHADIIGLQEVDVHYSDRSHFEDEISLLATSLHMHYAFAPIYDFSPTTQGAHRRQSGVAVISRYPIVKSYNHLQSRLSTEEANPVLRPMPGFLEAVVQVNQTPVTVYVAHLDYRDDSRVRVVQVCEMMSIISSRSVSTSASKSHGDRPDTVRPQSSDTQVLLGDFNAAPGQPELAPLYKHFQNALVNCRKDCFTFPADKPLWQLDFVMVPSSAHVVRALVPNEPKASDHRPVVTVVRFQKP